MVARRETSGSRRYENRALKVRQNRRRSIRSPLSNSCASTFGYLLVAASPRHFISTSFSLSELSPCPRQRQTKKFVGHSARHATPNRYNLLAFTSAGARLPHYLLPLTALRRYYLDRNSGKSEWVRVGQPKGSARWPTLIGFLACCQPAAFVL